MENSNGTVHTSGNSPRYYLFPVFTEATEIFGTICLDHCQTSCRERAKNLSTFCKWYKSIRLLFSVPKKYQFHLTENVYRNFHTNGKRSRGTSLASLVPIVEKWSLNALESSWFCISIVFSFNWGHFNSWEKLKTMLMQNIGVTSKEHYGMLWYFLEWSIGSELCSSR